MKKFSVFVFFSFLFLQNNTVYAQHIFLKAGDLTLKGSLFTNYENYVELTGVQLGADAEVSVIKGAGAAVGKANFDAIVITKSVDILSNELMRNIAAGKSIPLIEIITTNKVGQVERVAHKIELKNVFVTKIANASAEACPGDCGTVAESVSFVYKAIRITTYSIDSKTGAFVANPNPFELDISSMTATF
ncbi:type VI secretion system tube protein Hcp [Dyadobacter sp. CY356]|uniref:type VI secretion system tube protein Hcp n=1 Tax=Dyadobacter sp. CY356 TaxID=2906442 RepID=UPI001F33EA60|nr:type VI secretion system tube protein Hcp [Dyadobacter sp. CY356]MCF0056357.1 type VI secretion system tube protein Hcp [Dyadobacter sp. CY356]